MARRTHRKSRNGCLECKRRHVKCDEKRPICTNCTVSERVSNCEYPTRFRVIGLPTQSPRSTPAPTRSPSHIPSAPVVLQDQPVNMLHVELFHHLSTQTLRTFDPQASLTWLRDLMTHAVTAPYLINEMLALSALHLSIQRPDRREFYRYHAAQLQTHALALFNDSSPAVTKDTCIPLFAFSSILGIHMLADTLVYREKDFNQFLNRFVHNIRVYRGVRTILHEAWHMLRSSAVNEILEAGMVLYRPKSDAELSPGCATLLSRIKASKLGPELTDTYEQVIKALQSSMDVAAANDAVYGGANGVSSWPVLVDMEFSDLLEKRRPEALVILAHYGVLLYRFREEWMFGDAGGFIVVSVSGYLGYLGEEWKEWLEWPSRVLESGISDWS